MDVVGAVTTVAVYPSMHLGLGAALASAAMNMVMILSFGMFTYLSWFDSEHDAEDADTVPERPYPPPDFLVAAGYRSSINVACIGPPECGKSSLVNALRGLKPVDSEAAPVGLGRTTPEPAAYGLDLGRPEGMEPSVSASCAPWESAVGARGRTPTHIRIWDMPPVEGGRSLCPGRLRELGLAHFDAVLIVYAQRITAAEIEMARELEETFKVPYFLVRSQVDVDVDNEHADYGRSEEDTLLKLRAEAIAEGAPSVFLVSTRQTERHDLLHLVTNLQMLAKARRRALLETECPICFDDLRGNGGLACCTCQWCGNAVCGRCARKLRGPSGEAMCPFCRRWTYLFKPPAGPEED